MHDGESLRKQLTVFSRSLLFTTAFLPLFSQKRSIIDISNGFKYASEPQT